MTKVYREYRAIRTIDLTDGTGYIDKSISMRIEDGVLTVKVEQQRPVFNDKHNKIDKVILTLSKNDTERLRQFLNIELEEHDLQKK